MPAYMVGEFTSRFGLYLPCCLVSVLKKCHSSPCQKNKTETSTLNITIWDTIIISHLFRMASLFFRHGDAQALKAIVAAPSQLKLKPLEQQDGTNLYLQLPSGTVIKDPNAMAEALSCSLLSYQSMNQLFVVELPLNSAEVYSKVHEWLEWEQSVLRPAVYSRNKSQLSSVLGTLEKAVTNSNSGFLVGTQYSLADVSIFSTLFPLRSGVSLPKAVADYMSVLSELPPFKEGIQKV